MKYGQNATLHYAWTEVFLQQYLASLISSTLFITRLQVIFIFGIKPPFERWSEEDKCQEVKVTSEVGTKRGR